MTRKRPVTEEETRLFQEVVKTAKPLVKRRAIAPPRLPRLPPHGLPPAAGGSS